MPHEIPYSRIAAMLIELKRTLATDTGSVGEAVALKMFPDSEPLGEFKNHYRADIAVPTSESICKLQDMPYVEPEPTEKCYRGRVGNNAMSDKGDELQSQYKNAHARWLKDERAWVQVKARSIPVGMEERAFDFGAVDRDRLLTPLADYYLFIWFLDSLGGRPGAARLIPTDALLADICSTIPWNNKMRYPMTMSLGCDVKGAAEASFESLRIDANVLLPLFG